MKHFFLGHVNSYEFRYIISLLLGSNYRWANFFLNFFDKYISKIKNETLFFGSRKLI